MFGKYICLIFLFLCFLRTACGLDFQNESKAVLIMNRETGHVLFERNGHELNYPASTTKIATALFFLTKYPHLLDQKIVLKQDFLASITPQAKRQSNYRSPPHWLETDGSQIGLKPKEEITICDLLKAVLIASANDAANCLAGAACNSIPKFIQEMNEFLRELGCYKTNFRNPHGLHHPDHITTAYDLAVMAREALKHPLFRSIVSTVSYQASPTNLEGERIFSQTNRLMLPKSTYHYPCAYGIKTGSTKDAGKNLVAAASKNNRELIGVILGCQDSTDTLYQDMIRLFEAAFHEPKETGYALAPQTTLSLSFPEISRPIQTILQNGLYYEYFPSEPPINIRVVFEKNLVSFPLSPGDLLGQLKVLDDNNSVLAVTDITAQTVIKADPRLLENLLGLFNNKRNIFILLIVLVTIGYMIKIIYRKPRKTRGKSSYF